MMEVTGMRRLLCAVGVFAAGLLFLWEGMSFSQGVGNLTVAGNKHNLSISGTGAIKAVSETQICVFCHTPHMAYTGTPLWNHTMSSAVYTVSNPPGVTGTQLSTPQNPPDGDSRLCLSCHDGTVPIGSVQNLGGQPTTISMTGALPPVGNRSTNLGTNLSGHHLTSININNALNAAKNAQCAAGTVTMGVNTPGVIAALNPEYLKNTNNCYGGGCTPPSPGVQCTSCHDPHYDPVPGTTKFIRGAAGAPTPQPTVPPPTTWVFGDNLCLACHCACTTVTFCP